MGIREDSFTTTYSRQIIGCNNCGTHYRMYPLISEYISTMLEPCPRGDYRESFFDCINPRPALIITRHEGSKGHYFIDSTHESFTIKSFFMNLDDKDLCNIYRGSK